MPVLPCQEATVFVVGLYRSGTSLLYALLNQHPAIGLMYEADFLPFALRRTSGKVWMARAEFINQAMSRHGLAATSFMTDARSVYRSFAVQKGATWDGEKSPSYASQLLRLNRLFPEARLILIRRELVEVYGSVLEAGRSDRFFRRRGMLAQLLWAEHRLHEDAKALTERGVPVAWVDYMELVREPEIVCRRLCEFLKLPFDARMCSIEGADLSAVWQAPHHYRLRAGVITPNPRASEVSLKAQQRIASFAAFRNAPNNSASPLKATGYWFYLMAGAVLTSFNRVRHLLLKTLPWHLLRFYRFIEGPPEHQGSLRYEGFDDLDSWSSDFARLRRFLIVICSGVFLIAVAIADYLSFRSFSWAPFYFIPVSAASLACGRGTGLKLSLVGGVLWTLANPPQHPHPTLVVVFIMSWNCVMRFAVLGVYAFLLDRVKFASRAADGR